MPPLPLPIALAFAVSLGLGVVAALVVGRSWLRGGAALLAAATACVVPFLADPAVPVLRVILAMLGGLYVLHSVDLIRDPRTWHFGRRLLHMLTPWDTRESTFGPPRLDPRALAIIVAFAVPGVLSLMVLHGLPPPETFLEWLLRWLLALAGLYNLVEAVARTLAESHRTLGVYPPPLHVHPVLSRSLMEFWGRRWNLAVHGWLASHIFMPLARRRRPLMALALTFLVSGLIHTYLVWPAAGMLMAVSSGVYFLVQGALVAMERRLRLARLRPALAHAWTWVALIAPAPLLLEPLLRSLGL